jgi:general secretion pathway protein H
MQTAVPGRWSKSAGFTLLEILVVVVIIGVLSSVFLLSIGNDERDRFSDQARRFAALVRLAEQEAVLGSRDMAVELFADGYRFLVYEEQEWRPVEDDILSPQRLPEGMSWRVHVDGSGADMAQDNNDALPRIYLFSTGEITPFDVTIAIDGQDYSYQITGGLGGTLKFSEQQ